MPKAYADCISQRARRRGHFREVNTPAGARELRRLLCACGPPREGVCTVLPSKCWLAKSACGLVLLGRQNDLKKQNLKVGTFKRITCITSSHQLMIIFNYFNVYHITYA